MAAMWSHIRISSTSFWNRIQILPVATPWNLQSFAGYAKVLGTAALGKKGKGKLPATSEKRKFPVETDPHKLVNFVCGSNYKKTGQDVELKPDSEYPEWLWGLSLVAQKPIEEMDPGTIEYWRRLRKLALRRQIKLMRLRRF
nr:EOG090X0KWJ [Sida crystallina]